jgi:hypothetical protein
MKEIFMPDAKSGKAGSLVSPVDPKAAKDADVANPGEAAKIRAAQHEASLGKFVTVTTKVNDSPGPPLE